MTYFALPDCFQTIGIAVIAVGALLQKKLPFELVR